MRCVSRLGRRALVAVAAIVAVACEPAGPTARTAGVVASTEARPATATLVPATATPTPVPATSMPQAPPGRQSLRLSKDEWDRVLAADPNLLRSSPETPLERTPAYFGPLVEVKDWARGDAPPYGYARTDEILYLDLSGDGQEEAVIMLFSDGTAHNTGLLVYTAGSAGPTLMDALSGYQMGATAEGDHLVVWRPIQAGWESNCCPSGRRGTRYRLQGNQLVAIGETAEGNPVARVPTVERFYRLLNERRYAEAYAFLSPAFQSANPYEDWRAGYQGTVATEVRATDQAEGAVGVELATVDQSPAGPLKWRYRGQWKLLWSVPDGQWLLDQADIASVPESTVN